MQKITLVVAYVKNRVIGANGAMPWHLPEDFAFFKAYTSGKPVAHCSIGLAAKFAARA